MPVQKVANQGAANQEALSEGGSRFGPRLGSRPVGRRAIKLLLICLLAGAASSREATCSRRFLTGLIIGTLLGKQGAA